MGGKTRDGMWRKGIEKNKEKVETALGRWA